MQCISPDWKQLLSVDWGWERKEKIRMKQVFWMCLYNLCHRPSVLFWYFITTSYLFAYLYGRILDDVKESDFGGHSLVLKNWQLSWLYIEDLHNLKAEQNFAMDPGRLILAPTVNEEILIFGCFWASENQFSVRVLPLIGQAFCSACPTNWTWWFFIWFKRALTIQRSLGPISIL